MDESNYVISYAVLICMRFSQAWHAIELFSKSMGDAWHRGGGVKKAIFRVTSSMNDPLIIHEYSPIIQAYTWFSVQKTDIVGYLNGIRKRRK